MEKDTYLTFKLGKEIFAVSVENVLEVQEKQEINLVPRAPKDILGIINFRGNILPVINTRQKFNLPEPEDNTNFILIVFEIKSGENHFSVAATADAVKDVIDIHPDEIKPVPEMGMSYDTRYIRGTIQHQENFILILETEKVFSISEAEVVSITNN